MNLPRKEQFSGCLVGQCLGDALGFPVEGYPPEACRQYVHDMLQQGQAGEIGRGPFPFGQYTDDSQLARELLQSYADCGCFEPQNYAQRIAALFRQERIVGRGRATTQAAQRLIQGVPWEQAGTPPPAAGNGSAMRAGPIGLFFFDDPERLIQAAHDQGRITHQDPRCSAGAVAIAGAVALVLQRRPLQLDPWLEQLDHWTRSFAGDVADGIQQLRRWVRQPPEEAVQEISRAGLDPAYQDGWQGISPFVVGSVLWSLYAFLRTPEDYWATICTAIAVGGDVDTTAAMAGAISGAYLGLEAIPPTLTRRLTDQGHWGLDQLVSLAERCYAIKALEGVTL